ncbi:MAG: 3-hydroxybutyrate dehydrogenase [Deltaproteobacteria bacterium]|nr:3-hydroxybutyrate dehydrogenase [Candidatus Anaeroferrophillus wilburensis]
MIADKTAIVTGAGSGIGKAIALHLAKNGARVVAADLNDVAAEKTATEITGQGGRSIAVGCDVSREDSVVEMVEKTVSTFSSADIIVNNAGLQFISKIEEFPLEKWNQLISVMLTGTFLCTKACVPYMKEKKWGRIISISSAHGKAPSPWKCAYVAAKHGIIGFTKVMACELAEWNITANSICPGYVLTPLVQKQIKDLAVQYNITESEVPQQVLLKNQPLKKLVSTEELAALTLYLASDQAQCITGQAVSIDGGWTFC